uniref:MACPF domain-containing protein n=1 Tax=Leptobrachium leishanense TaxID=445787 RepID=A0A8C5P735_9ANUR
SSHYWQPANQRCHWAPWPHRKRHGGRRCHTFVTSIERFGQYGGLHCLSSLGESQVCKTEKVCEPDVVDCKNDFECESGRCIKRRLMCNVDNDCGDHSDEDCDDQEPKSPCRTKDFVLSEVGRTAGNGLNILGMSPRSNPFDNEFFNGLCENAWDGNTKTYYRKPWNVGLLFYETRADRAFTSETFVESQELLKRIDEETTREFGVSLSLKSTPSEINGTAITVSAAINSMDWLKPLCHMTIDISLFIAQNKAFFKVSGSLQMATFSMRARTSVLTTSFLDDVKKLPITFEKAEYYAFLEMYGTHYTVSVNVGGKYELVYVLDSTVLKTKGKMDVLNCLGYTIGLGVTDQEIAANAEIKGSSIIFAGDNRKSGVIENTISFIKGGTLEFTAALDEKFSKKVKDVNVEDYVKWASSLVDSPAIIKQKLAPIYVLIPTRNLERAIEEYIDEHSVCKCQPCQNGGTVMVVDGECICACTIYFTGSKQERTLKKTSKL